MNVEKMMAKYGALAGLDREKSHPHTLRRCGGCQTGDCEAGQGEVCE